MDEWSSIVKSVWNFWLKVRWIGKESFEGWPGCGVDDVSSWAFKMIVNVFLLRIFLQIRNVSGYAHDSWYGTINFNNLIQSILFIIIKYVLVIDKIFWHVILIPLIPLNLFQKYYQQNIFIKTQFHLLFIAEMHFTPQKLVCCSCWLHCHT